MRTRTHLFPALYAKLTLLQYSIKVALVFTGIHTRNFTECTYDELTSGTPEIRTVTFHFRCYIHVIWHTKSYIYVTFESVVTYM